MCDMRVHRTALPPESGWHDPASFRVTIESNGQSIRAAIATNPGDEAGVLRTAADQLDAVAQALRVDAEAQR